MKKIILIFSILVVTALNAQTNLIQNGDFEVIHTHLGRTKFEGWNFNRSLNTESVIGHNSNSAAKVYMNSYSFSVLKNGNFKVIEVVGGSTCQLSFWLKGEDGSESLEPSITWYDSNGNSLSGGREYLGSQNTTTSWGEKTVSVIVPSVAVKASLSFRVSNSGSSLTIDDVSLVQTSVGVNVTVPTGLKVYPFQREMEVLWHKGNANTKWEVVFDGLSTIVTTNKFIATNLEPNTNHTVKVRTIIGVDKSGFTTDETNFTDSFIKTKDSPIRVPFLRTLGIDGKPTNQINLFYNDLYNKNATIDFFVDGQKIQPITNKLTFPKKGKQTLKVIINEGIGYEWESTYKINVQ